MDKKIKRLNIAVSSETNDKIRKIAEKSKRTISAVIELLVEKYEEIL